MSPAAYLPDWLMPLFLDHLPFEACARLWDVFLLEGDSFLFRAALAVLSVLETRLLFRNRDELLHLLRWASLPFKFFFVFFFHCNTVRGEDKSAIELARREGRTLDGGKYEIYDVNEENLWERIDGMEDWWKESTWNKLTQRELPDL